MPTSSSPKKPLPPVYSNMPARRREFNAMLREAALTFRCSTDDICPDHFMPCPPGTCENNPIDQRG